MSTPATRATRARNPTVMTTSFLTSWLNERSLFLFWHQSRLHVMRRIEIRRRGTLDGFRTDRIIEIGNREHRRGVASAFVRSDELRQNPGVFLTVRLEIAMERLHDVGNLRAARAVALERRNVLEDSRRQLRRPGRVARETNGQHVLRRRDASDGRRRRDAVR